MGLTAFIVFVVPWMLLAVWLFSLPSAIRLGAPSAPWRPLAPGRDQIREQARRETIRNDMAVFRSGSAAGSPHEPHTLPRGEALGPSVEDTEPRE